MRRLFSRTPVVRGRFVAPWEREGQTADDYFSGLLQSNNPFERRRRDRRRYEDHIEEAQQESAMDEAESLRYEERRTERLAKELESAESAQHFLPYGAQPEGFVKTTDLPAWGTYQGAVSGAYSGDAAAALQKDAETLLPYKFDACPPLKGGAQPMWPLHGTTGVVLDIDGVVYRSKKMIEGSDSAIKQMLKLKIPLCFMTNGGGATEEQKAQELSHLIGVDIDPETVIMAHTPMQLLAKQYKGKKVLIVGSRGALNAAKHYGFDQAIHMQDYQAEHPELVPYKDWKALGITPKPINSVPYEQIAAVMCFTDSLDVLSDAQVIVDVLSSPFGQVGETVSAQQTIPLYMGNDDLLWATNCKLPRIGHGAIREMLSAVYESVTGQQLQVVQYGKPRAIAHKFAEQKVRETSLKLGWDPAALRTICMVGDNLETDIIGANCAGAPWLSVHVMTGIGSAPSAVRTQSPGDDEFAWIQEFPDRAPHYVAPSLDHFVREMLCFGENAVTMNRKKYYGAPNPVDFSVYGFDHLSV